MVKVNDVLRLDHPSSKEKKNEVMTSDYLPDQEGKIFLCVSL